MLTRHLFHRSSSRPTARNVDLVPRDVPELLRDTGGASSSTHDVCPFLSALRFASARACLSLCRPVSCFTHTRVKPKGPGFMETPLHQSGSITLRASSMQEDRLRGMDTAGMDTALIGPPEELSERYGLQPEEGLNRLSHLFSRQHLFQVSQCLPPLRTQPVVII